MNAAIAVILIRLSGDVELLILVHDLILRSVVQEV